MMSDVNAASPLHEAAGVSGDRSPRPASSPAPASPPATRPPRRTWKDPRLLVGVAIVATCVLLGARVLAGADDTVGVWVVRADTAAGESLSEADLERREVRFAQDQVAHRYLSADQAIPDGTRLTRDLGAGELLPREALAVGEAQKLSEVPVAVASEAVPSTLRPGELVDVWVTPSQSGGDAPRAVRVLEGVRVVAIPRSGGALGPAATRQVVVGVPAELESSLSEALGRLASGTALLVRRG